MNPDEYAARQAVISAGLAGLILRMKPLIAWPSLSVKEWLSFLELLYPQVEYYRYESARLARTFYDAQREVHHPGLPINEQPLEGYSFEQFVADMDPVRKPVSQPDATDDTISRVALAATRAVENAGRQQIIHAVENDDAVAEIVEAEHHEPKQPNSHTETLSEAVERAIHAEPPPPPKYQSLRDLKKANKPKRRVRGWARVATGRETCAWCLMLISRGPTYEGSRTSGLMLDDLEALRVWHESQGDLEKFIEETGDYMKQWHVGCDCKVVPVFDRDNWPGMEQAAAALELWGEASIEAGQEMRDDRDRVHTAGKNRGKRFTKNERAINALRRRLASGEVDISSFAAAA